MNDNFRIKTIFKRKTTSIFSHTIEPSHEKVVQDVQNSAQDVPDEDKKKKKKKSVLAAKPYPDYNEINEFEEELGAGHFEPNEGPSSGRSNGLTPSQCPLILSMEKRCRGVDLLSGDMQQELLPVCGIHQICYLCVSLFFHSLTFYR